MRSVIIQLHLTKNWIEMLIENCFYSADRPKLITGSLRGIEHQRGRVMRKLLLSCVGVLCAVVVLEPALADEPPARPRRAAPERAAPVRAAPQRTAPAQQANWSGGQVGGSNGVSSVNNSFVDPGSYVCPFGTTFGSNCFETPFSFSQNNKASYTIGPFVGYRVQLGSWVVGVEGDWSWKNAETSLNQSSSAQHIVASSFSSFTRTEQFSGSIKQKSDSSIRARLGTLVTPWSLLYVTGGVAFAEISGSFAYSGVLCSGAPSAVSPCVTSSSIATAATAVTWNDTRVGSTVGAGWETELFPGWKARAEYRYTDFGSYTKTFGLATTCTSGAPAASCTSTPSGSASIALRESFHTFRVGLAFDLWSMGKAPY
jgi:outer membrane immunogenic protein